MIQELKLVNRNPDSDTTNQTPFNGSSDIDFDEKGGFVLCTGEEGLEQNYLKACLTGLQLSGYGTIIFDLLGKKNLSFIRGTIMQQILSTASILKKNQLEYLSSYPTYDKKNIVYGVLNIYAINATPMKLIVSSKVRSYSDEVLNKQNLQELNMVVE